MLETKLGNLDIDRNHQKILHQIGTIISTLDEYGDHEPYDNYNKYVGAPGDEFPNEILRHNLELLNERLKNLHAKQGQPSTSTYADIAKSPKPEAKKRPKPGAKKSKEKEKEKSKDEEAPKSLPKPEEKKVKKKKKKNLKMKKHQ